VDRYATHVSIYELRFFLEAVPKFAEKRALDTWVSRACYPHYLPTDEQRYAGWGIFSSKSTWYSYVDIRVVQVSQSEDTGYASGHFCSS
jgi:hypothetical protein